MTNIPILYQDDDLLLIEKPAGITVNRAETTKGELTVQDWMEEQLKEQHLVFNEEQGEFFSRGGVVHRLDKETSGVLILAKNVAAFQKLQQQFKERVVKKVYVALAHGKIVPQTGEINVPVGRLPWNRKQFGIVPGGRESKTLYKVLQYYRSENNNEGLSFVELYPHSGRTHQIRVHLKYIHHPIFADFLYAGRKTSRKDRELLPRVFLHAAEISFLHPTTGETVSFQSPLPSELKGVLTQFDSI
jgi:23S rRNA pseudouridine1911/1915/1917 synthase